VVDDVDEMRTLIRRALSSNGYEVDVASTLAQAREMDPGGYDAVLVDAGLGHERGADLIEALRSQDPSAADRCLLITGGTLDALPAGVAFLAKPFQLAELVEAVHALQRPNAASPDRPPAAVAEAGSPIPASAHPGANGQSAGEPQAWQLLRLSRRLRTRERHELTDFLHDGPIQELTAVALELQMMSRTATPAPRFDAALRQLEAAAGSLRWLVDGDWPFTEPETRLAAALQRRTGWLAGHVTVDADDRQAQLSPDEVPVIADVVELMLLGMVTASPPARAHVAVRADGHRLHIELFLTSADRDDRPIGDPATAKAALEELACALAATSNASFGERHWRAQIVLRRRRAPAYT
jgi:DNA-binding response OmpR family regulator